MILFSQTPYTRLPDPELSDEYGLSFLSTNMNFPLLAEAYWHGFFPWYIKYGFVHWFHPPERPVLFPQDFKIPRSIRKIVRNHPDIRWDQNFCEVMQACEKTREESWIDFRYKIAYCRAHRKGIAHSVEYYVDNRLAGGLYGIQVGGVFTGESMFHSVTDGAKIALYGLVSMAQEKGIRIIDGQSPGNFIHQMGFSDIPRREFLKILESNNREKISG